MLWILSLGSRRYMYMHIVLRTFSVSIILSVFQCKNVVALVVVCVCLCVCVSVYDFDNRKYRPYTFTNPICSHMHCYSVNVNVYRYVSFVFRFGVPFTGPKKCRNIANFFVGFFIEKKNLKLFFLQYIL